VKQPTWCVWCTHAWACARPPSCCAVHLHARWCAGAGAAAAAADVAGYYQWELLRRLAMEVCLPWATLRYRARQQQQQQQQQQQRQCQRQQQPAPASTPAGSPITLAAGARAAGGASRQAAVSTAGMVKRRGAAAGIEAAPAARPAPAPPAAAAASAPLSRPSPVQGQAAQDVLKPAYDVYNDVWDVTRDLG
jgi:hypothetical protein